MHIRSTGRAHPAEGATRMATTDGTFVDYTHIFKKFECSARTRHLDGLDDVTPPTRISSAINMSSSSAHTNCSGTVAPGRAQLATLTQLLDNLGYTRSATQKDIHKGMIAAVLPRIFQYDSDTEVRAAMSMYGLRETSQQFMVLCPRRHGKTVATSLFIAAYILSVPACTVSVYSTARRASQELLQLIKRMVSVVPNSKSFEVVNNQETLELCIDGTKRRCSSYPGCSRTLRGTGGDLIVLEEAAYIDEAVFNEVVIPLLEIEVTSVIAISTPSTEDNYYSKLRDLRTKKGAPVFTVYTAKSLCSVCAAQGKDQCEHLQVERAPWKSSGKRDIVEALYGANSSLAKRELEGTVVDDTISAYERRLVHAVFDRPRIPKRDIEPRVIYVAVDPSGGGASKFAMASLCLQKAHPFARATAPKAARYDGSGDGKKVPISVHSEDENAIRFCVVGLVNEAIRNRDHIWALVVGHIRGLRKLYPSDRVLICVGVEANLGNEASHIAHMLRNEHNVICLKEGKDQKDGFMTTNQRKHDYYSLLEASMKEDALHFVDKLVSNDEEACMVDLKHQMCSFKRISGAETSAFTAKKVTFSGKIDGQGSMASHRLCDDLILSLQMCMFVSTLVYQRKSKSFPYDSFVTI